MEYTFDIPTLIATILAAITGFAGFLKYHAEKKKEQQAQIQHLIIDWVTDERWVSDNNQQNWGIRISNYSSTAFFDLKIRLTSNGRTRDIKFAAIRPGDFFCKNDDHQFPNLTPIDKYRHPFDSVQQQTKHSYTAECLDSRNNRWEKNSKESQWTLKKTLQLEP